jgi:hypothetical protein
MACELRSQSNRRLRLLPARQQIGEYMNTVEKIRCPNCGTEIDVNMALSHEIEERLKTEIEVAVSQKKDKEYAQRLNTEMDKMRVELVKENEEGLKSLQKTLKEKSEQVIQLNKTKAELEQIKLEKDEIESRITAAKDAELLKKLKNERESHKAILESELERIKREAEEENALKIDELK